MQTIKKWRVRWQIFQLRASIDYELLEFPLDLIRAFWLLLLLCADNLNKRCVKNGRVLFLGPNRSEYCRKYKFPSHIRARAQSINAKTTPNVPSSQSVIYVQVESRMIHKTRNI